MTSPHGRDIRLLVMVNKKGSRVQTMAAPETSPPEDNCEEPAPVYEPSSFHDTHIPLSRKGSHTTLRDPQGHEMIRFLSDESDKIWEYHSSIFEPESALFKAKFEYGRHAIGDADPSFAVIGIERVYKNEYQLRDVSDFAFESFMWGVRPKIGREVPLHRLCDMLTLATDWQFTDIATYARREIPKCSMDPIIQIQLARRNSIDSWLLDPYVALAVRLAPIEKDEIRILRLETTNAIMQARE